MDDILQILWNAVVSILSASGHAVHSLFVSIGLWTICLTASTTVLPSTSSIRRVTIPSATLASTTGTAAVYTLRAARVTCSSVSAWLTEGCSLFIDTLLHATHVCEGLISSPTWCYISHLTCTHVCEGLISNPTWCHISHLTCTAMWPAMHSTSGRRSVQCCLLFLVWINNSTADPFFLRPLHALVIL